MAGKRTAPWESGKVYPIELGDSFATEHTFHTLKYDFKPKSIDYNSLGELSSDGRNIQVTLKTKQQEAATASDVQFNGHATECKKDSEFVLLFDAERSVFVLERLTSTIALKQNRGHKRESGAAPQAASLKGVKKQLQQRSNTSKRRKTSDDNGLATTARTANATEDAGTNGTQPPPVAASDATVSSSDDSTGSSGSSGDSSGDDSDDSDGTPSATTTTP
eukprot:m.175127 g.175127  ORF g.175127 m.175127 type:complete len:220 (-) comp13940_c0_seq1:787-1446(-)